jgi:uncharacterized protein YigE (DUF2233 family)
VSVGGGSQEWTYSTIGVVHAPASALAPVASPVVVPNSSAGVSGGGWTAFAIGVNGHLETTWQKKSGSGWSDWADLGNAAVGLTGSPVVVTNASGGGKDGGWTAFAVGVNGHLEMTWQKKSGSGWSDWADLGNAAVGLTGSPVVVTNTSGGISGGGWTAFAIGVNGHLETTWQKKSGSGWSDWADLGNAGVGLR